MLRSPGKMAVHLGARLAFGFNHLSVPKRNYISSASSQVFKSKEHSFTTQNNDLMTYGGFLRRHSYSTESASTPTAPTIKLSKREQLKRAFKEYGATIVVFHVGISVISLGCFYALVSNGINLVPVLEFLGIGSSAIAEKVATGSTFVVAFAVHKVFAPARISITLGTTPFIVRYLRSKGLLKPTTKGT
ncbi:protein FAM210B, mitochondrial [Drosophila elegans]|uniref:protein FAM210B, mitochondrial n=1 Tax=Drosophila elegans TaxID=30023 RepID=UPI0007E836A7|nr:protein FAM210B, mitochondrial [Drosophila elegans]